MSVDDRKTQVDAPRDSEAPETPETLDAPQPGTREPSPHSEAPLDRPALAPKTEGALDDESVGPTASDREADDAAFTKQRVITQPSARSETARSATARSESGDTLLSAPAPASSFEVLVEDRLQDCERRLEELETRIALVERRGPETAVSGKQWLWWLLFFVALILSWQVLTFFR